jgi:hypothetical protein
MKLRRESMQYAFTMPSISINDSMSPHDKFFGIPSPITPEHCVDFGRIRYVTYSNVLNNKYKPRAFKCYMVGNAMNHSSNTYKVFRHESEKPREITVTRNVRWEHWDHPHKSKLIDS